MNWARYLMTTLVAIVIIPVCIAIAASIVNGVFVVGITWGLAFAALFGAFIIACLLSLIGLAWEITR